MSKFEGATYSKGTSDSYTYVYYFLRAAVRVSNFLHLRPSDPSARWPNAGGELGVELAFGISTVCMGVVFFFLFQFVRGPRILGPILSTFAGSIVLLAFPAAYTLIFDRAWTNPTLSSTRSVAIPELICACALFLVYIVRPFTIWAMGILMLLHYCFWILVLFGNGGVSTIYGNIPPLILLLLIPLGGIGWLLHLKTVPQDSSATLQGGYGHKWIWMLVGLVVSAMGLGALWLPSRGYSLVHAQSPDSLSLEMWRSTCQIGCPVYTVTIRGSGTVDYVGEQFVRVRGPERSFLSQEQIHTILEGFDRADFFSLEDKAFAWGYHTSWVGVKITIDGKTKEVRSDMYHVGSKSGSQAKFVEAAAAIDKVVGTDQWVKCGDSRCQP